MEEVLVCVQIRLRITRNMQYKMEVLDFQSEEKKIMNTSKIKFTVKRTSVFITGGSSIQISTLQVGHLQSTG